jgi:hypothetical protein
LPSLAPFSSTRFEVLARTPGREQAPVSTSRGHSLAAGRGRGK